MTTSTTLGLRHGTEFRYPDEFVAGALEWFDGTSEKWSTEDPARFFDAGWLLECRAVS